MIHYVYRTVFTLSLFCLLVLRKTFIYILVVTYILTCLKCFSFSFFLFGIQLFSFWAVTDVCWLPPIFLTFLPFKKFPHLFLGCMNSFSSRFFIKVHIQNPLILACLKICFYNLDSWRMAGLTMISLTHTFSPWVFWKCFSTAVQLCMLL